MIDKKMGDADVKCPFYLGRQTYASGKKLFCESPVPESKMTLYFPKKEGYLSQFQIFCCEHYKKCEIYRMVEQGYEEGE